MSRRDVFLVRIASEVRTRVCKRLATTALVGLALSAAAPGEAAPAVKHVLILQSFDRGSLAIDHFTAALAGVALGVAEGTVRAAYRRALARQVRAFGH